MNQASEDDLANTEAAHRWCQTKGADWRVINQMGRGATASVFELSTPVGKRALKVYDVKYSLGEKGNIERKRVDGQLGLRGHDCPYLIDVYEGGQFEDRLFLLMSRAPGRELEKCLSSVPRSKVRTIVDHIAHACLYLRSKALCHRDIKSSNVYVSDDFNHATLLDISVMREIHDPVGLGTDQGGQFPVVATARYAPPEYLFRLIEPDAKAWHALDVYQLGGLLHDLIMRRPLFEDEYLRSKENRYRFAWVIATVVPSIQASDIDHDLILTARRALDKDWERRSSLQLEDFFEVAEAQQVRGLEALGLRAVAPTRTSEDGVSPRIARARQVGEDLESKFLEILRRNGVTAKHFNRPGSSDYSRRLSFQWTSETFELGEVEFALELSVVQHHGGQAIEVTTNLTAMIDNKPRDVKIGLPAMEDGADVTVRLAELCEMALPKLAGQLVGENRS